MQRGQQALQVGGDPRAAARMSSAASGLRFCGMMLEPPLTASGSATKPNSAVAQSTTSVPMRLRWAAERGRRR